MKFQIPPRISNIVIISYGILTLFFRIKYESEVGVSTLQSLVIGLSLVIMPWSLIRLKVLNPDWFGLFNPKTIDH